MRVSIVTVSLDQAPFLERALLSVLQQDHADVEYVVVDGGSTDGSLEILERYRHRLAHLIIEPDDGPADALNKGFRRCTGEICAYVNADDALLPGAVRDAVARFEADPHVDLVYGHGVVVDAHGRPTRRFYSSRYGRRRHAYGSAVVMQQSTFLRRAALDAVGGFNAQNRTNWDGELLLDLALAGKRFLRADAYWAIFTLHPTSISGSQSREAEYVAARRRLFEKAMGHPPRRFDRVLAVIARVWKWVLDPKTVVIRLVDVVRAPEIPA